MFVRLGSKDEAVALYNQLCRTVNSSRARLILPKSRSINTRSIRVTTYGFRVYIVFGCRQRVYEATGTVDDLVRMLTPLRII